VEPDGMLERFRTNQQPRWRMSMQQHNPKLDPHPASNTEKDPDDWVSGDEPMTGAQQSYLTTLSEEAKQPPPDESLTKAEASKRIDDLKTQLGRS
jgi:hypothetical protein